jgi:hypothetical protein
MTIKLDKATSIGTTVLNEVAFESITRDSQMTTMIDGKRHELEFYEPPSHNDFLAGITEVLGPSWAFRCVGISEDKKTYIIEEVDIWKTLKKKTITPSNYTRTVPVKYSCNCCGKTYNVWKVMARDDSDQRTYYWNTDYCPNCLPVSVDLWLIERGYHVERPDDTQLPEPKQRRQQLQTTLLADIDQFD